MQNIDFYEGTFSRQVPQQPVKMTHDADFFSAAAPRTAKEIERSKKKVSRMLFFITALCIICFTTGLMVGIKFAAGSQRNIVDEHTANAVADLRSRVGGMLTSQQATQQSPQSPQAGTERFPVRDFPFVVRVGGTFDVVQAREIARTLSERGHTVILSKNSDGFRVYTGPYKTQQQATQAFDAVKPLIPAAFADSVKILKRS